jgi:hypothetical protein
MSAMCYFCSTFAALDEKVNLPGIARGAARRRHEQAA